jgi:hypothetical protein
VFSRHYLQHLRAFLGEDLQTSGFIAAQDAIATGVLQRLGLPFRPRIARAIFAEPGCAFLAAGADGRSVAVARSTDHQAACSPSRTSMR